MATKVKEVVAPELAASLPQAPATDAVEAKPARLRGFWKGFAPNAPIVFKDGSTHVFGTERFVTSDETLIAKIEAVMKEYNILPSD